MDQINAYEEMQKMSAFLPMWKDYLKDIFDMELYYTDKYFFTYRSEGENFYIIDVYVTPKYRRTSVVKELYDLMDKMAHDSGKKFLHSMVQRKDPHFNSAFSLNLKYGLKPYEERQDGKIFLRKELK